ncbi:MAG: histidinol-phosphatase [Ktedonobacterales bacterium]
MMHLTQSINVVSGTPEQITPPISNRQIAEVLFNIATILQIQQGNPYRIEAYRNAARGISATSSPVAAYFLRGEMPPVPGLGQRLRRKITELVTSGSMTFYSDLCQESLPEDVRDLMRVAHVGPKTALRLSNQLDIHGVSELYEAASNQQLRHHYGFGPRSEERLREGALTVLEGGRTILPAPYQAA